VEGEFSEVRLEEVLGSSPRKAHRRQFQGG
jgi:hypothetical protein